MKQGIIIKKVFHLEIQGFQIITCHEDFLLIIYYIYRV